MTKDYVVNINKVILNIKDKETLEFEFRNSPCLEPNLNDTGKIVLKGCLDKISVNEIVSNIIQEYYNEKLDKGEVYNDVINILKQFFQMGIIQWKNDDFPFDDFPFLEDYKEMVEECELKEFTINNLNELLNEYDKLTFNAYENLENEKNKEYITSILLSENFKFYRIKNKLGNEIILNIRFDKLENQLILNAIKCNTETIDIKLFDKLIRWVLKRLYNKVYYLEESLDKIPLIIFSNNNMMESYANQLIFKKIGTLKKEVEQKDVKTYIKYYDI